MRRATLHLVLAAAFAAAAPHASRGQNPFDPARKPGVEVTVHLGTFAPADSTRSQRPADLPLMLARLGGNLGTLPKPAIEELRRAVDVGGAPPAKDAPDVDAPPALTICISPPPSRSPSKGAVPLHIPIIRDSRGEYFASIKPAAPADQPKLVRLRPELFDRALGTIDLYWGSFSDPPIPRGDPQPKPSPISTPPLQPQEIFEVPRPYVHGSLTMDAKTLERVQGAKDMYPPTKRELQSEKFFARLPARRVSRGDGATAGPIDLRTRHGLLIWMDPTPSGRPPSPMHAVADELGFVCIGAADAGNGRLVPDRFQLAFDALATASRLWPIDRERVYLIGVSGGGKMSSILLPCFPEVFAGAVPIVGLCWYETLPTGEGKTVWPASYVKPSGARLTQFLTRRMAIMTGPNDFNYKPLLAGFKLFERDKLPARMFDIPGLGHEFPSPAQVAEAVRWIDEPARARRDQEADAARRLLDTPDAPAPPNRETLLRQVINDHPWTPAAWDAWDELQAARDK